MKVATFTVMIAFLWLGWLWVTEFRDTFLRVHVLDVGQGDAILIEMPDGELALIDGGPGSNVLTELGEVLSPWERKIDYVILTHPHADHISGLLDVLERYEIGKVFYYPVCYQNGEYEEFLRVIGELRVEVEIVSEIYFLVRNGAELVSRSGKRVISGDCVDIDNVNNASVVAVLEYGAFEVLFMGDAEVEREQDAFQSSLASYFYSVDILKAGHHCSRTASSDSFLRKVRPQLAICSCGEDNDFDHPHDEAIQRFENHRIDHLRTDVEGRITIVSDGSSWWIE